MNTFNNIEDAQEYWVESGEADKYFEMWLLDEDIVIDPEAPGGYLL